MFGIDPRSLALFRVALGAVTLWDLHTRALYLGDHYTDAGVLPRALLFSADQTARWSLHALSGDWPWQAVLFGIAALAAVAFMLGVRPRWAALVLWVLTVSLHDRNELVINKGDQIHRLLLFWSMFVPSGGKASVGSAALLIQAMLVWFVSATRKTGADWFPDGTALYYALHLDFGARPAALWLREQLAVTQILTYGSWALEWATPLLLFCPWRTDRWRSFGIVALASLHVGIAVCLDIGIFPFLSLCSLIPFIPASWWPWAPPAPRPGPGLASEAAAGLALALVLALNAGAVPFLAWPVPPAATTAAAWARLDQDWGMYAPFVSRDDGWYTLRGTRVDGRDWDLWADRPAEADAAKPADVAGTFPTERWRRYLMTVAQDRHAAYRALFAAYLCRRHAALGLTAVTVVFHAERTPPPGAPQEPARERILAQATCAPSAAAGRAAAAPFPDE